LVVGGDINIIGNYRVNGSLFKPAMSSNADTAIALATSRTIAGVPFNGSSNIDIPYENLTGLPTTIAYADTLATSRTIAGIPFNGSSNIDIPYNNLINKPDLTVIETNNTNVSNYVLSTNNTISQRITDLTTDMITENVNAFNKFIVNNSYNNSLEVNGTLTVNSNLIVLGDTTRLDTIVFNTERLEVINANNTATALLVQQNSTNNDIFVASNISSAVFRIANNGDVLINGDCVYKKNNRDVILDTSNYVLYASNYLVNYNNLINKPDLTVIATNNTNISNYVLSASNYLVNYNNLIDANTTEKITILCNTLLAFDTLNDNNVSNYVFRINSELNTTLAGKQATLTAGNGISIISNTISSLWTASGTYIYYNSGNVGIGSTLNNTTNSKLHVSEGITGTTGVTCIPLRISSGAYNDLGNGTATLIGLTTEPSAWTKCAIGHCRTGGWDTGAIVFICNSAANTTSLTMADERMRITNTGNVGIGTTNPLSRLHLHNNATTQDVRIIISDNTSTASGTRGFHLIKGNDNLSYLWNYENTATVFATNNVERMRITNTGNVGIGTTTPNYKLHVEGTLRTNELVAMLAGATSTWDHIRLWHDGTLAYIDAGGSSAMSFRIENTATGYPAPSYTERMRIYNNGAVGIQTTGYAIANNNMAAGSLVIGNINQDYGGGNNWTANTAGLMMECNDNTEIVIHDSGNAIHSFMRYTTNGNFRIGRNMGYGAANLYITGGLICENYITATSYILSNNYVISRNGYDAALYTDSGGMYMRFGDSGTGNSTYLEISASSGNTNFNSGSARNIYFRCNGYQWIFNNGGASYNPYNSYYWSINSDHRIKENIKKSNLKICYDNVKNINLYRFNYIDGFKKGTQRDKTQLGFVAQQVQQHFPKSVSREKTRFEDKREIPDLATLNIDQINLSLFGAVKQLIRVVEKQSKRIKKLEELLNIVDDDEVENDADEPYERIVCDEVDIDTILPSEPEGV
jgi:hypothetical protein